MKHKITPNFIVLLILLIALIVVITYILVSCGLKPTNAEISHVESYELYTLDNFSNGESRLILYDTYKVKLENIHSTESYGNAITIYKTTDDTQIIFTNNGITVINPKGYKESFTEGYMRRNRP